MKPLHHTTDPEITPSLQEIGTWPLALIHLHQRLAPSFARPEPITSLCCISKRSSATPPEKMAGRSQSTRNKFVPMACNACFHGRDADENGVRDVMRMFLLH